MEASSSRRPAYPEPSPTGITVLAEGTSPIADVVFVHGLGGHPKWTWSSSKEKTKKKKAIKWPNPFKNVSTSGSPSSGTDNDINDHFFWPAQLLVRDFPNIRIMTYGYDSNVSHFFKKPASQSHILNHGRNLLTRLEAKRRDEDEIIKRPIIFVTHSLGGIVVKEALRQSKGLVGFRDDEAQIFESTSGLIFFGTPHRGSSLAEWGEILRKVSAISGFDTNSHLLRGLQPDSERLEELREEFNKMLHEKEWMVTSFQETMGISSAPLLKNKVVPDWSSAIDDIKYETKIGINADHMSMCRFPNRDNDGYQCVQDALSKHLRKSRQVDAPQNTRLRKLSTHSSTAVLAELIVNNSSGSDRAADRQCVSALRAAGSDPRESKTRIEKRKDTLLKDSYIWVLQHKDFINWKNKDETRLLWIKGDPGKGKTMLMIGIIKELSDEPSSNYHPSLSYFFCQGTDSNLNSASAVIRGLIFLLVSEHEFLISHLRKLFDYNEKVFEGKDAIYPLLNIFKAMLADKSLPKLYLAIDALDECETGLKELLGFILDDVSSPSSRVKWLVSSRNKPDIEEKFVSVNDLSKLSLEVNSQSVSGAVDAYIKHKVAHLSKNKRYSEQTRDEVSRYLHANADGTFLWVALVCEKLLDTPPWNSAIDAVKQFPPGLQPFYSTMMKQVSNHSNPETAGFCRLILAAVTIVFRPLYLEEIVHIAGLPKKPFQDTNKLLLLIKACGSFLTVRDDVVYFVHQSVKEYFITGEGLQIFSGSLHGQHALVVDRSLHAMSILERDVCRLRYPSSHARIAIIDNRIKAISYICCFWVDHLINFLNGDSIDKAAYDKYLLDGGPVYDFLLKHLLHWFEALSLFGEFNRGILALHGLDNIIRVRPWKSQLEITPSLGSFAHDAIRIFRQSYSAVEEAPLQIYSSALLFAPFNSTVRRQFTKEKPKWVQIVPQIQKEWSPWLQTLEGHNESVNSVVFSPDGQQLVSASSDCTVRLWDVKTGTALQTFEGHSNSVSSVAFSPDGQWLASVSNDRTIRLWGANTALKTIVGHSDSINSVVFSPDGQQLASASDDYTVRLWDAKTGTELQTFEGHINGVNSVVFSPDGQRLASASDDYTVQLWDIKTGTALQTLENHLKSVNSVVFSPDGQKLASASDDCTVRLWDAKTGTALQTLEYHLKSVNSVVFSPDGQQLASASDDYTVQSWDAKTGTALRTLKGHSFVHSVVFNHDGQQLASASYDRTVQLWDINTGAALQTLEGHFDSVNLVGFSPDGQKLASASDDCTVRLWDTRTGAALHTLEGHGNYVNLVVFSPDGQKLASASGDFTIRLWDINTGTALQMLEGHSGYIKSVVFSPDGQQLASASYDHTIRLWDFKTGMALRTLKGYSYGYSIVFSPDSQQLASASNDSKVQLWDAKTGRALQTLEVHSFINSVVFNPDHQQLVKNFKALNLNLPLSNSNQDNTLMKYGINRTKRWITWNNNNVLWIPPEYRPKDFIIGEQCIAIGCNSGVVYILKFNPSVSPLETN